MPVTAVLSASMFPSMDPIFSSSFEKSCLARRRVAAPPAALPLHREQAEVLRLQSRGVRVHHRRAVRRVEQECEVRRLTRWCANHGLALDLVVIALDLIVI